MTNGQSPQEYGVTPAGFVSKPFDTILEETFARAREMFGADVDLRSSSPLRKILELTAAEDALLWMRLEDQYYGNFITTANGHQLDQLGHDLGLERRYEYAQGTVKFRLGGDPKDGCVYVIPLGTVVQTASHPGPPVQFRTQKDLALTKESPEGEAPVIAVRRGPAGNVDPNAITEVNDEYESRFFRFPPGSNVQVTVQNSLAFTGGTDLEGDQEFRRRLMDQPHTIWTAEALRQVVLEVDGVRDCIVWDPYGGLDRTQYKYGSFEFGKQAFSRERDLCSPYFFDVVVAKQPGPVWEGSGNLPGVRDDIEEALRAKRPISTFPNVLRAAEVEIGVRATVISHLGFSQDALLAEAERRMEDYIFHLEMGNDVLASEVLCTVMGVPGVIDVRDLQLLRCPPLYGQAVFSKKQEFQDQTVEAGYGENIVLDTREIAVFNPGAGLVQFEVRPQ